MTAYLISNCTLMVLCNMFIMGFLCLHVKFTIASVGLKLQASKVESFISYWFSKNLYVLVKFSMFMIWICMYVTCWVC